LLLARNIVYGLRYVFFLRNEDGSCKYRCTFCEIGKSNKVSSDYNITLFNNRYKDYQRKISRYKNHPLIYNRGNITDEKAFSRKTLKHILTRFNNNSKITHLSLNSREKEVTSEFINFISEMKLSYPIHFILGQESFSTGTLKTIGKNSNGEYQRLANKLIAFNYNDSPPEVKPYNFGIDCNLLFLPELYIGNVFNRYKYDKEIKDGFIEDVKKVLEYSSVQVPLTINLHPYYKVKSLPYENADIDQIIDLLPQIHNLITHNNKKRKHKISIFIGFRGIKIGNKQIDAKIDRWNNIIDSFNEKNKL